MGLGNKGKKRDGVEKKKVRISGEEEDEEEKKEGGCSGSQPRVFNIYI
jgi:hypothetical protein